MNLGHDEHVKGYLICKLCEGMLISIGSSLHVVCHILHILHIL